VLPNKSGFIGFRFLVGSADNVNLEEEYMPQDPQKRQKTIMKKRSKQKANAMHKLHQPGVNVVSPDIIRQARSFPLWAVG
jgi:hypothetical protein